ncbi:MAG: phosphatidylglycerophosphatase A [Leptolyngbya sp. PLA3]|nr:MAG: phosphatidylglycerophosphatase A [Cyanobacteria bacterium CYA]MCE7967189.1 phosphatidylglycerophosphatase A [Leptolyngbya sp. PL-A3]
MIRRPGIFWNLLTVFGLGHMRPASGTWGSLPPVVLAGCLILVGAGPASMPWVYYGALSLVLLIFAGVCVVHGDDAEARWGADASEVVADEVAGQCIPLMFIPSALEQDVRLMLVMLAGAFFTFRFFDISKLEPANALQRLRSGWGVMLDDLAAGLYAGLAVWVLGLLID